MRLGILNREPELLNTADLEQDAAALQYQLRHHLAELWNGIGASSIVEVITEKDAQTYPGVLAICQDSLPDAGALAEHMVAPNGHPLILASAKLAEKYGSSILTDLSHEAIEGDIDSQCTGLVEGRHPLHPSRRILVCLEPCDPTQREYDLGDSSPRFKGRKVSDFVTPVYFDITKLGRTDVRTTWMQTGEKLPVLGCLETGYLAYVDPISWQWSQYMAGAARQRSRIREAHGITTRAARRQINSFHHRA
jgi:hypothetical protein